MASLYKKRHSPFWYVQFLDKNGVRRNKSTGLRHDNPKQTAQARVVRAKLETQELERGVVHSEGGEGWAFVPGFLARRNIDPKTLRRYTGAWEWISLWLSQVGLTHPSQIRFRHGEEFARWRCAFKKKSGKTVGVNTARLDAKVFSMIMAHAVKLELCTGNPLTKMDLPRELPEKKPEITDAEFNLILPALEGAEPWMKTAFLIAMHTGCRLRETRIARECVDLKRETIIFEDPKGGTERAFSVPLPKQLVPLFQEFLASGRLYTLDFPFQPSRKWQGFFKRFGLDHLCFHCLRVTYITRLARRGVPLSSAMRLVNHASSTVHKVYQRLQVDDVRTYAVGVEVQNGCAAIPESPLEK